MPRSRIEWSIAAVNQRLRDARVRCRVYQKNGGLYLQATLPPKPGSDPRGNGAAARPTPYQQKIYLGLPPSEEGLRIAEGEARLLGSKLLTNQFDWRDYLREGRSPETKPAAKWVEEFKANYLQTHSLKASTWKGQWEKVFNRLPQATPLTSELLVELVLGTERDTRNRLETASKLQELANFAGVKVDLLKFKGNYGASKVQHRDIPSDELIAECWAKIPNPQWQWMYGIMAACGLRDHECFFCEWTDSGLQVLKGKTGPRLVFQPLYPEWVAAWDLKEINLPFIQNVEQIYEEGRLGDKVARQFRRYKIPFTPYDLRHAFGIRASVTFDLPPTTAAALMGHSPEIHLQRYHRHIKLKHNQEAARRVLDRGDRPLPPSLN